MKKAFFAGFFLVAAMLLMPQGQAHAQTPMCDPSEIANFVPYIYDGELHSFDYFHNGVSGTPVRAQVGNIDLLPTFTSVWSNGVPPTKIHVDVPGWYGISGTVPVRVEILSQSGCLSTQTFIVTLPEKPILVTPSAPTQTAVSIPQQQTQGAASSATQANESPVAPTEPTTTEAAPIEPAIASTVQCTSGVAELTWTVRTAMFDQFTIERSVADEPFAQLASTEASERSFIDTSLSKEAGRHTYRIVGMQDGAQIAVSPVATCNISPTVTEGGKNIADTTCGWGSEWWTVFLIALVIVSLVVINALEMLLMGNGWRFTVALFVPFALLLGLWFAFDTCRENQWFPILVTLITLGTLFAPTFLREDGEKPSNL